MLISLILKNFATLGFIGYMPIAPGTFGTLTALVFFILLKPSVPLHLFLLVAVSAVGVLASNRAEKMLKEKDSRHIVIDEFAGFTVAVLFLPQTLPIFIAAFLLFRFFDILKPPPIRSLERYFPGGVGVMADDLMAGICTNVLLQAWKFLG